jgi:hypothetical protein
MVYFGEVPWALRRMHILDLLGGIFYRLVKSIWPILSFNFKISLLIIFPGRPIYFWEWDIEDSHYLCVGSLSVLLCPLMIVAQSWVDQDLVGICSQLLSPLDGLFTLSMWSDCLCLFWLILVWSLLCQI